MQQAAGGLRCGTVASRSAPVYRARRSNGRCASVPVAASQQTVPVTITVKKEVGYGEGLKLVGNQTWLGSWELNRAAPLKWTDGHVWTTTVNAPVGVDVCFKLVHTQESGPAQWEGGSDRTFKALGPGYGLKLACKWDATDSTKITAYKLGEGSASASASMDDQWPASSNGNGNGYSSNGNGKAAAVAYSSPVLAGIPQTSLGALEGQARSTSSWVGTAPEFVRSRKDNGQRQGVWDTSGLQGAALQLVHGDRDSSNWLKKLEVMKGLLVDRPHMMRPQLEELAACYVYATWINTGAISCVETGGHHRPNHHANNALQMFRSLEWSIADASQGAGEPARVLAARRLHTRLPSISGEFRVSVPLTRIRDIAHRNDIPKDLKDEIKHTLQNKLHRSAGPEDLVATEEMLKRITAVPGQYSGAFVAEFKVFTRELREFFNASGLTEVLDAVSPSLEDAHRAIVTQFRAAMQRLEQAGSSEPALDDLMAALLMGTQARCYFAAGLSSGLRNDVGDDTLSMRQRWRLAEIRIEDYVFVLLARILGQLEAAGGPGMLARANAGGAWRLACTALTNGLRHLGLSQFATTELLALENELEAWLGGGGSPVAQPDMALRGKASVERVLRLASQYSDLVMEVYCGTAGQLGPALGVPEHMSRIFGESEVRASVAFQVSRLAAMMVKALRGAAKMAAWDGLVTGEAVGRLVAVPGLSPEAMQQACSGHDDNVVLLAHRADGDEEVGPLGPRLAGVVLCQELPHLSHLGVRARQEKCTFATCDDEDYLAVHVKPLVGRRVRLLVTSDSVSLAALAGSSGAPPALPSAAVAGLAQPAVPPPAGRAAAAGARSVAATQILRDFQVLPLSQATVDSCGSKAAKCGDLERLAQAALSALFTTPPGVVLPFGTMELALQQSPFAHEYQKCLQALEQATLVGPALDLECDRMVSLVRSVQLPMGVVDQLTSSFHPGALLAVRSSANVEDLAGMSAAGLYESKVGVPRDDAAAVSAAVAEVWASLYTRRAVLSRRSAGVAQTAACMAVLLMELVAPEVSFVLHTTRPRDNNAGIVLAELAPGQGETLASGTRGTPWRLEIEKASGKVDTLAFANFSRALVLPGARHAVAMQAGAVGRLQPLQYTSFDQVHGARKDGRSLAAVATHVPSWGGLVEVEVDYSQQPLSTDAKYREQVGQQLAAVGMAIEASFEGVAQDIEGGLTSSGDIVVFQTRPQLQFYLVFDT